MENESREFSTHHRTVCPACGQGKLQRIKRKGWVARVPDSKSYQCTKCSARYARLFDLFLIKIKGSPHKQVQSQFDKTRLKVAAIVVILCATVYLSYTLAVHFYENESSSTQSAGSP